MSPFSVASVVPLERRQATRYRRQGRATPDNVSCTHLAPLANVGISDFSGSSRNRNRNPIPGFPGATGNRRLPLSRRPASKRRSRGGLFLTELPPQKIGLWPRAHPGRRHFPKRIHGHCQRVNLQLFVVESAVHGMTITITITITSRKREHEKSEMRPLRTLV